MIKDRKIEATEKLTKAELLQMTRIFGTARNVWVQLDLGAKGISWYSFNHHTSGGRNMTRARKETIMDAWAKKKKQFGIEDDEIPEHLQAGKRPTRYVLTDTYILELNNPRSRNKFEFRKRKKK